MWIGFDVDVKLCHLLTFHILKTCILMSISFRVLEQPFRDKALLVMVDSGQSVKSLLFDYGDGCLSD
jgi:hypothetical protein